MRRKTVKRNFSALFSIAVCLVFALALFLFTTKILPNSVRYSAKRNDTNAMANELDGIFSDSPLPIYDSAYEIESDGPFQIRLEGENLYVYENEIALYRINASLADLSESDLARVCGDIYEFQSKRELIEKVEYMES